MVTAGASFKPAATPTEVAAWTVRVLSRTVRPLSLTLRYLTLLSLDPPCHSRHHVPLWRPERGGGHPQPEVCLVC
jgi:hypothetical protein